MPRFLQPARRVRGVTLIELMIVIVIVGILANVALPAYTSYSQRGKITEATATLSALRSQLEQYYQDNRDYGSTGSLCGGSTSSIPSSSAPAGTLYFTYTCNYTVANDANTGTAQAYLLTASGSPSQGMQNYTFTIDYRGNKQTTVFPGVSNAPRPCWLLKVGDC